jgi:ubiquinone/menaquinone biosynthesis C-methylase UbiE
MNPDVEKFYSQAYEQVMGGGLIGLVMKFIHRILDKNVQVTSNSVLLELGSGHGQHFAESKLKPRLYIQSDFQNALGYDEKFSVGDLGLQGMIKRLIDCEDLSLIPDESIDCVIMSCVLSHLNQPEKSLREIRRVLKPAGIFSIYLPCEPGIFLRLVRYFSTRRKFKKAGIVQEDIHWIEHRNHYPAMNFWIKKIFSLDTITSRKFPFDWLIWDFNLFTMTKITKSSVG